jgi:hypothetical protein
MSSDQAVAEAGNLASEILTDLFFGCVADVERSQGFAIAVFEYRPPELPGNVTHISIVDWRFWTSCPEETRHSFVQFEAQVTMADSHQFHKDEVVASRGEGMDWNPLVTGSYPFHRKGMSVDAAYRLVKEKQP